MQRQCNTLVAVAAILCACAWVTSPSEVAAGTLPLLQHAESTEASESFQPSPDLSPAQVVRIQVEALGHNDTPYENAGIEIAFRFASPANKIATGPLDRFIRLVHNPLYRPLLNQRAAQYGELQITGQQAIQPVILTSQDGERVGYVFFLSQQEDGPCEACWMTDSVIRFSVQQEHERLLPTI